MTDSDLSVLVAELRRLEQAASIAPWDRFIEEDDKERIEKPWKVGVMAKDCHEVAWMYGWRDKQVVYANADFIAAARNALVPLLDALERLTTERDEARKELATLQDVRLYMNEMELAHRDCPATGEPYKGRPVCTQADRDAYGTSKGWHEPVVTIAKLRAERDEARAALFYARQLYDAAGEVLHSAKASGGAARDYEVDGIRELDQAYAWCSELAAKEKL
jgi:hypothetical protein